MINRGGEKISPAEIDDILLRHPAVAEAVAFAVPSEKYGEEVHACRHQEHIQEEELRTYRLEYLVDFKVPVKFHVLNKIPRGDTGKIQRIKMANLLGIF